MTLKIGQVAERADVSVRALRYYEEQGLLRAERTPGGQRVYQEADVERVRVYRAFFAAGLTSSNVAQLMPCIDSGHTDAEQRRMLHEQRERLRARLEELRSVVERLDRLIAATDGHP
ncbi:MerR family transcriptional regulator [Xylanimonas oleitrophica]|uniref:MerR family transcriptional regulator n=1 Tax=Xylanimonas oleitrophica TaxID=2607479 RepID=UPI001FEA49E7|nr:MerR family transcriptional regulator [Xylanimonas oleitrophica]